MKKIKLLIFGLLTFIIFSPSFFASSSINVQTSKSTVIVGNTFNVTVKVSGSEAIGSWDYTLTYDSNILKLTSGNLRVVDYSSNGTSKSATYNYTFKAIASGNGKIGIKSYDVLGYTSEASMNPSVNSVSIKTMTQAQLEATYSTNAFLKSLGVENYSITPEFNKDVKEYNLEVENDISTVNILASKADNTASISGSGEKSLVEGNNKIEIVVTAQKGNTNTYVININRKELEPIYVKIDNKTYSLVRKSENLPSLSTYTGKQTMISDTEIPTLYSEITKYNLVGVKDEEGNISLYIYDNDNYQLYQELAFNGLTIYPLETKDYPDGFVPYNIKINESEITGYKLNEDSSFAIIYGTNVLTGDKDYYMIDLDNNTISRYFSEYEDKVSGEAKILLYLVITFGILFIVTFITLLIVVNKKRKPKEKKIKVEKEKDNQ